jgi:hypothetical protein
VRRLNERPRKTVMKPKDTGFYWLPDALPTSTFLNIFNRP